jgi:hypothetical protein
MRPALKPALARLWRDDSTLQLGREARRAVLLHGLDAADRALITGLDGSRPRDFVVREAADPTAAAALLARLERAGALDDASAQLPGDRQRLGPDLASLSLLHPGPGAAAAVLRRRADLQVEIRGCGRVGSQLAALLAASGIGLVTTVDATPVSVSDPTPGGIRREDVGRDRGVAAAAAVARASAARGFTAPRRRDRPDLLILAADRLDRIAPDEGDDAERWQRPLLVVGVRETTGVIGPLVLPGLTGCLRCQHLHRCDRDPSWPHLAAALAGRSTPAPACDVTLSALVAALAAGQALQALDGQLPGSESDQERGSDDDGDPEQRTAPHNRLPAIVGGTLEMSLLDWQLRRRSWPVHPRCVCTAATSPAAFPARLRVGRSAAVGEER